MDSISSFAAAAREDAGATADLLERVWPDAYRIAWSVLQERTAAEDAAQEACLQAMTSIAKLRRPDAFRAWFYRIVVNEAKRRLRDLSRAVPLDPNATSDSSPRTEERIDLQRALRSLEPPLRIATVLFYYFGLSGSEIGTIVGASPMTVRWRLFIARRRLRAMLGAPPSLPNTAPTRTGAYADEPQALR